MKTLTSKSKSLQMGNIDLSQLPSWMIATAIFMFAVGFLISVFFLDEEKFFMGVSFGKAGVSKTTEIELSKKVILLEERMKTIEKQANNSLSSKVFDNALLTIYKPDKDGNVRCPAGWRVWVGSEGKFLRSLSTDRKLGDTQNYATALPHNPFKINTSGRHTHNITGNGANGSGGNPSEALRRGNGDKASHPYDDAKGVQFSGEHTHLLTGGDIETRPTNVAVLFCIKS